jgi:hypothetical protein
LVVTDKPAKARDIITFWYINKSVVKYN